MVKFSLPTLPSMLKTSVLDSVHFRDSLNLFRTTKSIQRHYLLYGLFPKKVNGLRFDICPPRDVFVNIVGYYGFAEEDKFLFSKASIADEESILDYKHCYHFESSVTLQLNEQDPRHRIFSLFLISKVRSCKTLYIRVRSGNAVNNMEALHQLFDEKKLLAKIQHVANLEIEGVDNSDTPICDDLLLNHYSPFVEREMLIFNSDAFSNSGTQFDFPRLLQKNSFKNAKISHFHNWIPDFQALSPTNAELYTIHFYDSDRCHEAIESILNQGEVAGQKRLATFLLLYTDYAASESSVPDSMKKRFNDIVSILKRREEFDYEEIDKRTGESRLLTSSSPTDVSQSDGLSNLIPFIALEKKISKTDFTLLPRVLLEPNLVKYFRDKNKNLWIVRTLLRGEDEKLFEVQVIVKPGRTEV